MSLAPAPMARSTRLGTTATRMQRANHYPVQSSAYAGMALTLVNVNFNVERSVYTV